MLKYRLIQATEAKKICRGVFALLPLRITDCILLWLPAGAVMTVKDTIRIYDNGRTHEYMQVLLTFHIWFLIFRVGHPYKTVMSRFPKEFK